MGRTTLMLIVAAAALLTAYSGASAQAYGSYVESCTQIEQRGPFLRALCRDVYGRFVPSRLDLRYCPGGDVSNQNGRLACESRRRPRVRNYEYGPRDYDRPGRGSYYEPY